MRRVINPAIEIGYDSTIYRDATFFNAPDIRVPDKNNQEKYAQWCFHNMMFAASFYNRPITYLGFGMTGASGMTNAMTMTPDSELYPIQFMYKMLSYYLNKQRNLDFTFFAPLTGSGGMPPGWINGQEISTYLKQFQGIMRGRLSNVEWTAKPVSERISEQFNIMYNMLKLNFEHKEQFQMMADNGFKFAPANGVANKFVNAQDIDRFMSENYIEEGAEIMTNLANGEWFTNEMAQLFISAFMNCTITALQGVEISIVNGQNKIEEIDPPYIIKDIRVPNGDDYHKKAKFVGYMKPFQPIETFNYPELTPLQVYDIQQMCSTEQLNYNQTDGFNFQWMQYDSGRQINSTGRLRVYWKAREFVSAKHQKSLSLDKKDTITKDKDGYYFESVYNGDLIANKYMVRWGETVNQVERYCKPNEIEFPIQIFQPNTYLGTSVSEVARVFKIQNEIDMWRAKLIQEAAKAKGKVIFIQADLLDKSVKAVVDDLEKVGITVIVPDSEDDTPSTGRQKLVEAVDLGLSENVKFFLEMVKERKADMMEALSISPSLLGQQASYSGASTTSNIQTANGNGMSYLIDGSLNFAVNVMRYVLGQTINLKSVSNNKKMQYCIGEKGIAFIDFMGQNLLDWRDIYLQANISDMMDAKNKEQLNALLLGLVQNGQYSVASMQALKNALKIINAKSYASAIDDLSKEINQQSAVEAQQNKQKSIEAQQAQQAQIVSTEKITAMNAAATAKSRQDDIDRKGLWNLLDAFVAAKNTTEQQVIKGLIDKTLMSHEASLQPQQPIPSTTQP